MKRLLCLLLSVLMLLSLCACGASDKKENKDDTTTETTGLPAGIMQPSDPDEDDVVNVLFISNSGTSYFTDELYGMMNAAGHGNINLCQLYYSGCSMKQHYDFWKGGKKPYKYYVTNKNGVQMTPDVGLLDVLPTQNWDYIVLHNNAASSKSINTQTAYTEGEPYVKEMLAYLRSQFPLSQYLWMNKWAPDVGYKVAFAMTSVEQRDGIQKTDGEVAKMVRENFGLEIVPCGDAWSKVRDLEMFTTAPEGVPGIEKFSLFTMIFNGKISDDSVHDGDIGGGQYLNACVWFEILTGESCVGNTFRPKYTYQAWDLSLSEEKIDLLQKTAHEAVEGTK